MSEDAIREAYHKVIDENSALLARIDRLERQISRLKYGLYMANTRADLIKIAVEDALNEK